MAAYVFAEHGTFLIFLRRVGPARRMRWSAKVRGRINQYFVSPQGLITSAQEEGRGIEEEKKRGEGLCSKAERRGKGVYICCICFYIFFDYVWTNLSPRLSIFKCAVVQCSRDLWAVFCEVTNRWEERKWRGRRKEVKKVKKVWKVKSSKKGRKNSKKRRKNCKNQVCLLIDQNERCFALIERKNKIVL